MFRRRGLLSGLQTAPPLATTRLSPSAVDRILISSGVAAARHRIVLHERRRERTESLIDPPRLHAFPQSSS